MDYNLTESERALEKEVRAFYASHIKVVEYAEDISKNLRKLSEKGYLCPGLNDHGLDMVREYLAGEQLSGICAATYLSARATGFLCGAAVKLFGTLEQNKKYLPSILNARMIGGFAYSESGSGSDVASIETQAEKVNGRWAINGHKHMVVNAPIADLFIVFARTEKKSDEEDGFSLFMVEKKSQGCSVGGAIATVGARGLPMAAVTFDHCMALETLGEEIGIGLGQLNRMLALGNIGLASMGVGIGKACLDAAKKHAKERKISQKSIGIFQEVGFKLADMFTSVDLGRMIALRAAWAFNVGEKEAEVLAACAKLFAGESATKIANWAMQIFAGRGYVRGSEIKRLYCDARLVEICEHTSVNLRQLIAGKELDKHRVI